MAVRGALPSGGTRGARLARPASRPRRWQAAAAVGALLAALSPTAGNAGPEQLDPGSQLSPSTDAGPTIEIDVDVANSDTSDVKDAFDDLTKNVNDKVAELAKAQTTVGDAEVAVREAKEAVTETEERLDTLLTLRDEVVTNAFVSPPSGASIDSLFVASMSDLAMKQALLSIRAGDEAGVLQELEDTRSELEDKKEKEDEAAREATEARNNASARLADLEAAMDQNTMFFIGVDQRLEHNAAEAAALADLDPKLASQLEADQKALAAKFQEILDAKEWAEAVEALAKAMEEAEEARRRAEEEAERWRALEEAAAVAEAAAAENPPPSDLGPASGDLATVDCPGGGSITVDSSLSGNLSSLLSAASAAGVNLCGGGYRDPNEQIALREAHCGTSYYDIYEAPSSSCSPPTARPGTSQHELGLAIDFTCDGGGAISSQSSPCFVWLENNAASYGLYNLPSEPWHWSTTGN